jgi:Dolichyl-phosphate-mannose-protein mannosyltransferase
MPLSWARATIWRSAPSAESSVGVGSRLTAWSVALSLQAKFSTRPAQECRVSALARHIGTRLVLGGARTLSDPRDSRTLVPTSGGPVAARSWMAPLAAAIITAVAVARIVSTYHVFNQAWDEPAHLATGMEWLDVARYSREPLHPPLARVAIALGPYLEGDRSAGYVNTWQEGNALLQWRDRYQHNLALARLGVLPFFLLAALAVYLWTRDLFGAPAAAVAVLLFTTIPPVLGHAGLATTELAAAGTLCWALYAFSRWLREPTPAGSIGLGVAAAAAVLSKFSALLFLPAGCAGLYLCHRVARRDHAAPHSPNRLRAARLAYLPMLVLVWAGYRFSIGPLITTMDVPLAQRPGTHLPAARTAYRLAEAPIYPAPEFFQGLSMLYRKNEAGQKAYLLGDVRTTGWWYYFPVALAVKTPLALGPLLLAYLWRLRRDRERRWELAGPFVAALVILLVCLPSRINIGVRHVLPIYPLLAICAAGGAVALWTGTRRRWLGPAAVSVLVAWQVVSSARAHPDYVAYFNELANDHPERVLVDSDLDNGMDLRRLADTLRALRVPQLWIAYAGSADLSRHGLPPYRELPPRTRVTGWVAASLYDIKLGSVDTKTHDEFAWLDGERPVATVGRSIRLFHLPAHGRLE